jgi:lactoylglutathione lyase
VSTSIGNVALYVSDLARSEAFYTDVLGLEVLTRIDTPEVREVIVGRAGEGSQLMLAWRPAHDEPVTPSGIWKVYVATDDAQALYDRAVAAGATPLEPPRHLERFRVTIAFVADPDGYVVELGQRHET